MIANEVTPVVTGLNSVFLMSSWDQTVKAEWMNDMVATLSGDVSKVNQKAMDALDGYAANIYAENANRAAYGIEGATRGIASFALVDEYTARNLMMKDGDLLPRLDKRRDVRWNRQKFQSAITQGILQGESIDDISKRVQSVVGMNERAARRAARTATTGAENAGRVSSYERAKDMGIEVMQEWLATLDSKTRGSHRELDGQRIKVGQKFVNGCRYPGDPEGPAHEVYNCRCTLVAYIPGINYDDWRKDEKIDGMSYEEWKSSKQNPGGESWRDRPITDEGAQIYDGMG